VKKFYKKYINNNHTFDKKTMIAIFSLIIVISGMFGWLYEFIFYYFNEGMKHFYWRGGNFLPWINIYAIGALMIYFLTYKFRKSPLKVFLISVISTGILELVGGAGMYIIGDGFRCWNYNTEILNFGNIGGFVCLRSVLIFGIFGLLLIYLVVPILFSLANKMNKKVFFVISVSICALFLIDEIYNLVIARVLSTPRASDVYKELGLRYVNFKS
jgi:uncharacterized membrane protein